MLRKRDRFHNYARKTVLGSSASLTIAVLQSWNCDVYVSTRGQSHRKLAASLGATWVGTEKDKPPVELDRAITFAPSGDVVISALASLLRPCAAVD